MLAGRALKPAALGMRRGHPARGGFSAGVETAEQINELAAAAFYGMARPFLSIGRMLVVEERRSEPWQ